MNINESGWRPERPQAERGAAAETYTGNKALMLEEPLSFEIGGFNRTGVDIHPAHMCPQVPAVMAPSTGIVVSMFEGFSVRAQRGPATA